MGVIMDLTPVERDRIERVRTDLATYYQLEQEKNVWVRIFRESVASPTKQIDPQRAAFLLGCYSDLNLSLTLGKDWELLHYLLTGTTEEVAEMPLSQVVLGGEKLFIDQQWSHSPPVLLSVQETQAVAQALAAVPVETISARYQPDVIIERCYHLPASQEEGSPYQQMMAHLKDNGHTYYWKRIGEISHYYSLAAEQSMGMLKSLG
jgi:hypothetical protein